MILNSLPVELNGSPVGWFGQRFGWDLIKLPLKCELREDKMTQLFGILVVAIHIVQPTMFTPIGSALNSS